MSTSVRVRLHDSELGELTESFGPSLKISDQTGQEHEDSTTGTASDSEDGSTAMTSPESHAAEDTKHNGRVPTMYLTQDEQTDEEYERELEMWVCFQPDQNNDDAGKPLSDSNTAAESQSQFRWSIDMHESRVCIAQDCYSRLVLDNLRRHDTKQEAASAWAGFIKEEAKWLHSIRVSLQDAFESWKDDTHSSLEHLTEPEVVNAIERFRNSDHLDDFADQLAEKARSRLKSIYTQYLQPVDTTIADTSGPEGEASASGAE
jgi:hypothetical protein